MKNNGKKLITLGILGVLLGRILNRVLPNYFGNNGSNVVIAISAASLVYLIILASVKGYYRGAVQLFVMSIPMFVAVMGLYVDNMDLLGLGILLVFIIYPIMIFVLKNNK